MIPSAFRGRLTLPAASAFFRPPPPHMGSLMTAREITIRWMSLVPS